MNTQEDLKNAYLGMNVGIRTYLKKEFEDMKNEPATPNLLSSLQDFYSNRATLNYVLHQDIDGFGDDLMRVILIYDCMLKSLRYYNEKAVFYEENLFQAEPIYAAIILEKGNSIRNWRSFLLEKLTNDKRPYFHLLLELAIDPYYENDNLVADLKLNDEREDGFMPFKQLILSHIMRRDWPQFLESLNGYLDFVRTIYYGHGSVKKAKKMLPEGYDFNHFEDDFFLSPAEARIRLDAVAFLKIASKLNPEIRFEHFLLPVELQQIQYIEKPLTGYPVWQD